MLVRARRVWTRVAASNGGEYLQWLYNIKFIYLSRNSVLICSVTSLYLRLPQQFRRTTQHVGFSYA